MDQIVKSIQSVMVERDHANLAQLPPIGIKLEELAEVESGMGFIYGALSLLASRHRLSDVSIVLVNSAYGTQYFRLDGRIVDAVLVEKLGSSPGVYCTPDVVPQAELDAVSTACQRCYSLMVVRYNVSHNSPSTYDKSGDTLGSPENDHRSFSDSRGKVMTLIRSATSRRKESSTQRGRARATASKVLLLCDTVVFIMATFGLHGPVRLVLGLILGVVIPGWCIVAPLKLESAPLEFGLALAVSLSLLMLIAEILMASDLWHLAALEEATCVVSFPFLLHQSKIEIPSGRARKRG